MIIVIRSNKKSREKETGRSNKYVLGDFKINKLIRE
jgi:hypothetical protein